MNRTLNTAIGIALAIGGVACERSQIATDPAIESQFGLTSLVPFEGQFPARQIELVSVVCDQGVCSLQFEGSGVVNIMGQVTFTNHVVEDYNTAPCFDAPAEIVLTGATGSITLTAVEGSVCPSPSGNELGFISGRWDVTDGTGEFAGITGSGITRGPIGGTGPVVHFSGTVSY